MLRLTAKATQFGHKTFTSWLIESAGTVPIKRRKDSLEGDVDNSDAMLKLMEVIFSDVFTVGHFSYFLRPLNLVMPCVFFRKG